MLHGCRVLFVHVFPVAFGFRWWFLPPFTNLLSYFRFVALQRLDKLFQILQFVDGASFAELRDENSGNGTK
jgi:hypothetical protein